MSRITLSLCALSAAISAVLAATTPALAQRTGVVWGEPFCATDHSQLERGLYSIATWPDNKFYYTFDPSVTPEQQGLMLQAMAHIASVTNVEFVPWTDQPNYNIVRTVAGLSSFVSHIGMRPDPGPQTINIGLGHWNRPGILMHEIGHALGLWHEHQRPDRGPFIEIHPGLVNNNAFITLSPPQFDATTHGVYDLGSIMHYNEVANLSGATERGIIVRPPYRRHWQMSGMEQELSPDAVLSIGDRWVLSHLYPGPTVPPPAAFALTSPAANAAVGADWTPVFSWEEAATATMYRLQVDTSPVFASPLIDVQTTQTSYEHPAALEPGRLYWWRITASNDVGTTVAYPLPWMAFLTEEEYPTTLYVDDSATPDGRGTSWDDAITDLAYAMEIAYASGGVTMQILVGQGTYRPDFGSGDRSLAFWLPDGCHVLGGYAGVGAADPDDRQIDVYTTVLSGDLGGDDAPSFINFEDNSRTVVISLFNPATTMLEGFTITGGRGDSFTRPGAGGGAVVSGGAPVFRHCQFVRNLAEDCGAAMMVYASAVAARLEHCEFLDNTAVGASNLFFLPGTGGGAVWFLNTAMNLPVTDCIFSGNRAPAGGAIFCDRGRPRLVNCILAGNSATGTGGAYAGGGAIFVDNGTQAGVINCTIADNASVALGGGLRRRDGASAITVRNSILWGNTPDQAAGGHLISSSIVQGGFTGTGNLDADPLFTIAASGNYRLQPGSPAIDSGNNAVVPAAISTDLDGNPRFHDDPGTADTGVIDPARPTLPIVDRGAFEFQGDSTPPCPVDWDDNGVVNSSDISAFITSWLSSVTSGDLLADFNGDDAVNSTDISAFITAWLDAVVEGC